MLVVYRKKPRLLSIFDGTLNVVALRFPYAIGTVNWWGFGEGTLNPAQVPGTTTTGIAVSVTNSLGTESILLTWTSQSSWSSPCLTLPHVLAPLTVGLSASKCRRVRNAHEIYTLFDTGRGGDKGRDKISTHLRDSGCVITHLSCPDHRDDPGEMRKKELRNVLSSHIILDAV
jgi:hypothetical protein